MVKRRESLYWDPMPHLAVVFASEGPHSPWHSVEETFRGKWEERNWRNVPGPFYGAMTDNCWVGRLQAPRHVLYGDDIEYEQEFLYRQPGDLSELRAVIAAVEEDPWAGWACDGNAHWTPTLVSEWWRDRGRLRDWITAKHRVWVASERVEEREAAVGLTDYLAYLDGDLERELRIYSYFLATGVSPTTRHRLPSL